VSKKFATVSALQGHLKTTIMEAIQNKIAEICMRVVRDKLLETVYHKYIPQGDLAYDRTYELMDSVTVGNFQMGYKYATFEIFMDTNKINPYSTGEGEWNQHADMGYEQDVSEYIPLWVEEGTEGSLWDREGAHYMEKSHYELEGSLHQALARELRGEGWDVTLIS